MPLARPAVQALISTEFARYTVDVVAQGTHTFLVTDILLEICWLESRFDPNAIGREQEVGLFQIHPVNFGQYNTDAVKLRNPVTNVHVAREIFEDMGGKDGNFQRAFSPWTTYPQALKNLQDRGEMDDPISNVHPGGGTDPYTQIPDVEQIVENWTEGLKSFFNIILDPTFWKRVGIGWLGFMIIVGAVILWNKDSVMQAAEVVK